MANPTKAPAYSLSVKEKFKLSRFLVQWEMILVYILILINLVLMTTKSNLYFTPGTIQSIIQSGMDLSPLVLGMIFVLMVGDIDVSVAATMITASMVTGLTMDAGIPSILCVVLGILAGGICGAFNGFLVAYMKMPSVIVTISTSMLFRGIVKIVLDVNVLKNFPKFYVNLAWMNIAGIPIALLLFLVMAAGFIVILHKSTFGRKLYIIGNNSTCATYSGINVERTKLTVFIIMGLMAGITSMFFVGRMGGGVSSTMGTGYELDAIAICVLGGISTNGGKGKLYGPVIATLIMAFLNYTLGLMGVDANSRKIMIGFILIIAVLIPSINKQLFDNIKLYFVYAGNKNIEALNVKAAEEVKALSNLINETKKDIALNEADKAEKLKKYNDKINFIKARTKEQTQRLKAEMKNDRAKASKVSRS
ncbi:MAG: branched-chain amino acid transporter permease [Herbinix sp.]|jgi:rhamnose transport system permease protein|nr:branched-chain amino acid transporter permease [Herbinix sp.]